MRNCITLSALLLLSSMANASTEEIMNKTLGKLEKMSEKVPEISKSLDDYRVFEVNHAEEKESFLNQLSEFKKALKEPTTRAQIKELRKACRKDPSAQECMAKANSFKTFMGKVFDSKFIQVNTAELYADRFIGIAGFKMWGDTYNALGWLPGMYGVGLQFARSIVNFNVCALPYGGDNFGVVASVVPGIGLTSGLYVGTSGICYELGLMYGIGAYSAVSYYHVMDRANPFSRGGQQQQQQEQFQLQGDEETVFPALPKGLRKHSRR